MNTYKESFRAQDCGAVARGSITRCTQEVELFADASSAAKWLHVAPFGPVVNAVDGRSFQISDINRLAAASSVPMLLDWEHNSEKYNGSTRAAGWLLELQVEDGIKNRFPRPGVWARAEFTEEGGKDVAGKFYRYLSPVLLLTGEERDAVELVSVALTNRPALRLAEINEFRAQFSAEGAPVQRHKSNLQREVHNRLRGDGYTAAQIAEAESFVSEQRAPRDDEREVTDAATDRELVRRGYSAERIAEARAYLAERKRAARG